MAEVHCAHEGCTCNVPNERAVQGDRYCSDYCQLHANEAPEGDLDCGCKHDGCREAHVLLAPLFNNVVSPPADDAGGTRFSSTISGR